MSRNKNNSRGSTTQATSSGNSQESDPEVNAATSGEGAPRSEGTSSVDVEARLQAAREIVKRHSTGSAGVGLVPIPLVDLLAFTGIQVRMVKRLSEHYSIGFRESVAKSLIISLVGATTTVAGVGVFASVAKCIPLVGQSLGALSASILGAATTYATGQVFIQHFETGGTLLDFDPEAMRSHYQRFFEQAKRDAQARGES